MTKDYLFADEIVKLHAMLKCRMEIMMEKEKKHVFRMEDGVVVIDYWIKLYDWCPDCGGLFRYVEGDMKCYSCGFSECA
jgi:hypothetical protein